MHQNKQNLLLHTCCGPCSTAVLEKLAKDFQPTLYFYNPNLDSEAEHTCRLTAQKTAADQFQAELITGPYDPATFTRAVAGLEAESEGGTRCTQCFVLRLEETAKFAKENDFHIFTTTLSVSPRKNADLLNEIGAQMGERHGVDYLKADFKKENGYQRSVELAKGLALYRQNYCGCRYSLR